MAIGRGESDSRLQTHLHVPVHSVSCCFKCGLCASILEKPKTLSVLILHSTVDVISGTLS